MAIQKVKIPQPHFCRECIHYGEVLYSIGGYCPILGTDVFRDSLACAQFDDTEIF